MKKILLLISAIFILLWGLSHLFPVPEVADGYDKAMQGMEQDMGKPRLIEGFVLIFLGILLLVVNMSREVIRASRSINLLVIIMLLVLIIHGILNGCSVFFLRTEICQYILALPVILMLFGIEWKAK